MDISQQAVSEIEQSERMEEEALARIAKALGVRPEPIKLFSKEVVFNNIQHNSDMARLPLSYKKSRIAPKYHAAYLFY